MDTVHTAGGGYGAPPGGGYGPPPGAPPGGGYGGPPGGGYGGPPGAPPGGGYGGPPGAPPGGGYGGPPGAPPDGGYGAPPGAPPGGYGPPGPGGYGPPGPGGPPPRKGPSTGLIIGLVAGGLFVVLGISSLFLFFLFKDGSSGATTVSDGKGGTIELPAKASSNAYEHLPASCDMVLRADAARIVNHPAMKKHIVPVLEELQAEKQADPDAEEFKEFLHLAGIDPKEDIKDTALCMSGLDADKNAYKMTFVFGGSLRPGAVVPALEKSAKKEAGDEIITVDGQKAMKGKTKKGETIIIGQAKDGAVIFSNDQTLFAEALKTSKAYQSDFALPLDPEAALVVSSGLLSRAATSPGVQQTPFKKDVAATKRVVGTLSLANPQAEIRVSMTGPKEAQGLSELINKLLLPTFKKQAAREKSMAGEIEALNAATVKADGNDVIIQAPWSAAGVEKAAEKLAEEIRKAKSKGDLGL